MEETERIEKFCGIDLFHWDGRDDLDVGEFQFYDVEFCMESMKKYNHAVVYRNLDGLLKIYEIEAVVWEGYITDIPEVMEALIKKYKK